MGNYIQKWTIFIKFFKGCFPQILLGLFLNIFSHITLQYHSILEIQSPVELDFHE